MTLGMERLDNYENETLLDWGGGPCGAPVSAFPSLSQSFDNFFLKVLPFSVGLWGYSLLAEYLRF